MPPLPFSVDALPAMSDPSSAWRPPAALRLLHTADWQIGRLPAAFEADDAAALAEARFGAVERMAVLAREHAVHAVLVAGDVFDAQTVTDKTVRRLFNAMQAFDGPWLLLPGNHDAALAESVWTRAHRLGLIPPNAQACLEPVVRVIDGRFALLPAPLVQRHTHADLTAWFETAVTPAGLPRVGLAHGCVQGLLPEDLDSANPIAAQRAAQAGLDYLALGDWHGTRCIDARTWYAGTPEPDRFRANDAGNALLLTLEAASAPPRVEILRTARYRWHALEHRLEVPSDLDALLTALAAFGGDDVLQLRVEGTCDLAGHRRLEEAVAAARARVRAVDDDRAALRLAPTAADLEALRADGYVGEVLRQLRDELQGPQAERARDALLILAGLLEARAAGRATATGTTGSSPGTTGAVT